jgi:hypothetical protein
MSPAVLARTYPPRAYAATPVPSLAELHLMNRMGCGYTPATLRSLRQAGGPDSWFEDQLRPAVVPESAKIAKIDDWFPGRHDSAVARQRNNATRKKEWWEYGIEFGNWTMLRRMFSTRTVLETMVDFWSNHFHISPMVNHSWLARQSYDTVIRQHALGRFDQLLPAVSLHPAMLLCLDNYRSLAGRPNENHGRELLELHTVGPGAGYTEPMVRASAVILSGWTVAEKSDWQRVYNPGAHTTGPVTVLGFTHANTATDGRDLSTAYLNYLAHHPSTARTIARKLAIRFVSDNPPESLVAELAGVFLRSGTDIRAVLRALVASAEFRASAGAKVRTPYDDLVATARVLGVNPTKPVRDGAFATELAFVHGADRIFNWPRPDGPPQANATWCSASRILDSYRMHGLLAGGYYPGRNVAYRGYGSWLPQPRLRFDRYVDHLSRVLLGRRSTALILQSACEATQLPPREIITRKHPAADYLFPRLAAALLDSPAHLTR